VNSAIFTGQSTVTISGGSASFSGSFTQGTLGPTTAPLSYPTTYVQVTSGTYSGYVFDIDSVNSQGAIVASDVPAALNGQTIQIRVMPHMTLTEVFTGATGLTPYADAFTLTNPDGSKAIRYWTGDGWVADDYSTPAGQTVIYPGQGFVFTASAAVTLVTSGAVQTVSTAVPLYAGIVNLVGAQNPGAATKIQSLNLASTLAPYADAISTYTTHGSLVTADVYYSDGVDMLNSSYAPLPPNSSDSVPAGSGIAANVGDEIVWLSPKPVVAP
jgi:hypothetical protein